jgi:hypothetical protein
MSPNEPRSDARARIAPAKPLRLALYAVPLTVLGNGLRVHAPRRCRDGCTRDEASAISLRVVALVRGPADDQLPIARTRADVAVLPPQSGHYFAFQLPSLSVRHDSRRLRRQSIRRWCWQCLRSRSATVGDRIVPNKKSSSAGAVGVSTLAALPTLRSCRKRKRARPA